MRAFFRNNFTTRRSLQSIGITLTYLKQLQLIIEDALCIVCIRLDTEHPSRFFWRHDTHEMVSAGLDKLARENISIKRFVHSHIALLTN